MAVALPLHCRSLKKQSDLQSEHKTTQGRKIKTETKERREKHQPSEAKSARGRNPLRRT